MQCDRQDSSTFAVCLELFAPPALDEALTKQLLQTGRKARKCVRETKTHVEWRNRSVHENVLHFCFPKDTRWKGTRTAPSRPSRLVAD
jgi:hypothetical protein